MSGNRKGKIFSEVMDENFLHQIVREYTSREAALDLMLTTNKEQVTDI